MPKISKRNLIFIFIAGLVVLTLAVFWYVFPAMERGNLSTANVVLNKSKQYQDLLQQQASFQAGKADLQTLSKKPYQPSDFFSKDTSVVQEIETLETLAKNQRLELELSVTGTKAAAQKAPTQGDIVQIPYTLTLTGKLADIHQFLQRYENLQFITHAQNLQIASVQDGKVKATLSAVFFVQK